MAEGATVIAGATVVGDCGPFCSPAISVPFKTAGSLVLLHCRDATAWPPSTRQPSSPSIPDHATPARGPCGVKGEPVPQHKARTAPRACLICCPAALGNRATCLSSLACYLWPPPSCSLPHAAAAVFPLSCRARCLRQYHCIPPWSDQRGSIGRQGPGAWPAERRAAASLPVKNAEKNIPAAASPAGPCIGALWGMQRLQTYVSAALEAGPR